MANGPNVGYATLSVIPSMRGTQAALASQVNGPAQAAGRGGGAALGGGLVAGLRSHPAVAGGIAAVLAGAGLFRGLESIGQNFDAAFDQIQTGTGATGEQLAGLRDDFRAVFRDVPGDADVAARSIASLNTLTGESGESLSDLSTQVLEASRLLGEDGAANSQAFGRALRQWQLPAEEGVSQLDGLFAVTQEFDVGLGEITSHLTEYGSVLQNAGFSMEESAALMGQLEAGGLSVSRVMPGLNMAFRNWAVEGKDSREELGRVVEAMEEAGSGSEALAIASDAFGAEGAQRLTTAVRGGALELDDLMSVLEGSAGAISDTADETDSWRESWQRLKNRAMVGLEPLARGVFDAIGDGLDGIIAITDAFDEGGIGAVFDLFRDKIVEIWPDVRAGLADLGRSILAWVREQGPILARQLLAWGQAFVEWILPQIPPALRELGRLAGALGTWILEEGLPLLAAKLVEWGGAFIGWIAPKIPPLLVELGKLLADLTDWVVTDALPKILTELGKWAAAFVGWVGDAGVNLLLALTEWWFTSGLPWFRGLPGKIVDALGDLAGMMFDAGKEAGGELLSGLAAGVGDPGFSLNPINWGLSAGNWLTRHDGGLVPGLRGQEVPILAMAGETVLPTHKPDFDPDDWGIGSDGGVNVTVDARGHPDPWGVADAVGRDMAWRYATATRG